MLNVKIIMKDNDEDIFFENVNKISLTNGVKTENIENNDILSNNFEYQNKTICLQSEKQSLRIQGNDILYMVVYKMN